MSSFTPSEHEIVDKTSAFVKNKLLFAEKGHDWLHIQRVLNLALNIAAQEQGNAYVVALAALLHDIADEKFKTPDEPDGKTQIQTFLNSIHCPAAVTKQVVFIVENVSYKDQLTTTQQTLTPELAIVRDADRLDAMGAIGIARTFHYGGYKNREMYNTNIPPTTYATKEAYIHSNAPTINHFYEKLLLLKDLMITETGKSIAKQRHAFMLQFLEQFYSDCSISPKFTTL